MNCVHLRLPVLLIHVALFLHLPHGITVLLNVNLMGSTLDRQAIDLFPKFEDVTLVLSKPTLHSAHPEVKRAETARCFRTAQFSLLLDCTNFLESLLLFLSDVILQPGLSISNVALQVATHNCHLIEAVAERIL